MKTAQKIDQVKVFHLFSKIAELFDSLSLYKQRKALKEGLNGEYFDEILEQGLKDEDNKLFNEIGCGEPFFKFLDRLGCPVNGRAYRAGSRRLMDKENIAKIEAVAGGASCPGSTTSSLSLPVAKRGWILTPWTALPCICSFS